MGLSGVYTACILSRGQTFDPDHSPPKEPSSKYPSPEGDGFTAETGSYPVVAVESQGLTCPARARERMFLAPFTSEFTENPHCLQQKHA
jgi:hypothetical protein